jgi:hypothetical protein
MRVTSVSARVHREPVPYHWGLSIGRSENQSRVGRRTRSHLLRGSISRCSLCVEASPRATPPGYRKWSSEDEERLLSGWKMLGRYWPIRRSAAEGGARLNTS